MLWHLVDGRGRIQIVRTRRKYERANIETRRKMVDDRISEQQREGLATVLIEDAFESAIDLSEGLVPGGLLESTIAPNQGRSQSVGVVVELAEGRSLGADESAAEGILLVASNTNDPVAFDFDRDSASGLTQRASPIDGAGLSGLGLVAGHKVSPWTQST